MVPDEVSIFNLALNAVGGRSNLSSTTERDRGAEVCRLWYPVVRDQILAAAPWPSCKAFKRLALKAKRSEAEWTELDPEPGYTYAYSSPNDMLHPRYVSDYSKFSVSSYKDNIKVVNTNVPDPILVYTKRNYVVGSWESELQMAIALGLAANIAMPVTGKAQRAELWINQANDLVLTARQNAANEGEETFETLPDWIQARGYTMPSTTRFFYPMGALLTAANAK